MIIVSQCQSNKREWVITSNLLISFFENNLDNKFIASNFSEALNYAKKNKAEEINIVAHGSEGFLDLGKGYTNDSLEKELRNNLKSNFKEQKINLWSCYGGSVGGIKEYLERCLNTEVNAKDGLIGRGNSLDLDYETELNKSIANLPITLHTNSVGFDVIDNGNGTFGLVVYYGTWHAGADSKTTEGALSLYTLATGGDSTDSDDYTVEAYGQGGAISNQTYYFTNPPKNTGDITFTTTDFNTTTTSFIEGQNGVGTTDLTDRGFNPGTNMFFGKSSDSSTLYAYNSTNGSSTANDFRGIYGYQSAYLPNVNPGTYRAYYDGKGSWDSTDPLNAPAITMVFEPIGSIKTALITISGSGALTVGEPPKILNNSVDGDNGASTADFVTSGRDVVLNGTFDSSLASTKDTLTVDITTGSTTTTYTNASSELTTTSSGTWTLNLTNELSPATYSIVSTIKDTSNNSYSNTQSLTIVSGSLQSITTDDGISSTDLITTDKTIKLNGIYSSANATDIKITVKDSSNNILVNSQSPTSTTGDNWVYDLTGTTLSIDTYTVTVTVSESTGDSSSSSTFQIIDGPEAPVTTSISEDTGTSGDFTTTDTTLTISGTFDASDDASNSDSDGKIQVTVAGVTYTDTGSNDLTVDYSAGTWSLTPSSTFAIGSYTVLAEVTDANGNYNSSSQNILVADAADTTAPTAPAISSIVDDNGTNTSFTTTDTSIAIKGTFDASDYAGGFTVSFGGNTYTLNIDTQLVANGNNWTLTYPLDASTGSVVATATDAGGNQSTTSQTITVSTATIATKTYSSDKHYKFAYTAYDNSSLTPIISPHFGSFSGDAKLSRLSSEPSFTNKPSGLSIGKTGLDFSLTLGNLAINNKGKINTDLSALIDGLTTNGKHLAYYSYSESGSTASSIETLTFDPTKKAGARFYDTTGNGSADKVNLELIDGGYGDKDGTENGTILDPSTAGAVDLTPIFSSTTTALTVADATDTVSAAAFNLNVSISSKASSVNQIGYVALNSSESDTLTYDLINNRGIILLSNVESSDAPNLSGMNTTADISLINGQKLVFFEVVDNTLESLLANNSSIDGFGSSFNILNLSNTTSNSANASNGGNTIAITLQDGFFGINDLIASDLGLNPILDFTGLTGTDLEGTVSVAREADYDSTVGFYKIQNSNGAVTDPITGGLITPGSTGYKDAALDSSNLFSSLGALSTSDGNTVTSSLTSLAGGEMVAPYASISNTGQTYFSFKDANADGLSHFREFGNGVIGLEDIYGGGDNDFDDLIFGFDFNLA